MIISPSPKYIIWVICLFWSFHLLSNDNNDFEMTIGQARNFLKTDLQQAIKFSDLAIKIAVDNKNFQHLARAQWQRGFIEKKLNNPSKAIAYYNATGNIYLKLNNYQTAALLFENCGTLCLHLQMQSIAKTYYEKGLYAANQANDAFLQSRLQFEINICDRQLMDFKKSIVNFLNLIQDLKNDPSESSKELIAKCHNQIGIIYYEIAEDSNQTSLQKDTILHKAIDHYHQSIEWSSKQLVQYRAHNNIGNAYLLQGETLKAKHFLLKALTFAEEIPDNQLLIVPTLNNLAQVQLSFKDTITADSLFQLAFLYNLNATRATLNDHEILNEKVNDLEELEVSINYLSKITTLTNDQQQMLIEHMKSLKNQQLQTHYHEIRNAVNITTQQNQIEDALKEESNRVTYLLERAAFIIIILLLATFLIFKFYQFRKVDTNIIHVYDRMSSKYRKY